MIREKLKVGEVCNFVGGSQPPKSTFSSSPLEGYVRLIQIRDYKSDGFLTYIPKNSTKKFCDATDVMIGRYGPPIFQILRGLTGAYNVALMKAKPKENVTKNYLYYFLKQKHLFDYIDGLSPRTGGQTGVDVTMLKEYPISLPSIDYQMKVAGILGALDEKMDLNNKINAELEAMAKLIYEYWFVQFDFPDANDKPYKSSGGRMVYNETLKREIPEGWRAGDCSVLFDLNPALSIKKGVSSSYIDMNALPTSGFMTKKAKEKPFSGGVKFQNGDVVIARITPCLENGKTGLISLLNDDEVGFGSTEFIVLRGKSFDLRCFGACLARSEKFRKYAISKMTGTSGRKRVSYKELGLYEMPIPSKELLIAFEGRIAPLFERLTASTKENEELTNIRDWLLPMLMNGQVTVKNSQ